MERAGNNHPNQMGVQRKNVVHWKERKKSCQGGAKVNFEIWRNNIWTANFLWFVYSCQISIRITWQSLDISRVTWDRIQISKRKRRVITVYSRVLLSTLQPTIVFQHHSNILQKASPYSGGFGSTQFFISNSVDKEVWELMLYDYCY